MEGWKARLPGAKVILRQHALTSCAASDLFGHHERSTLLICRRMRVGRLQPSRSGGQGTGESDRETPVGRHSRQAAGRHLENATA